MKIFKCPVVQYYVNAAFLSNLRNCLLGSKTQQYFGATQLTIDEYLLCMFTSDVIVPHSFYFNYDNYKYEMLSEMYTLFVFLLVITQYFRGKCRQKI